MARLVRNIVTRGRMAAVLAVVSVAMSTQTLAASGIEVVMNQAKIVKLARPADTIVIGNPEIADAAVQDSMTIVLTAKGFGVTNLVVLDADGSPIVDEQVYVSRGTANSVRVYRRANVQTLSCTPYCDGAYRSDAERTSDLEIGAGQ